jgi:hypothetical protein
VRLDVFSLFLIEPLFLRHGAASFWAGDSYR